MSLIEDMAAQLRAPFPPETIGKLPRITCKECRDSKTKACDKHRKGECAGCGNWISPAHIHLDYVGHAAATARLLSVDPSWTWEPCATTPDGLPLIKDGMLWIRLTVGGVTRLGVGTADGKTGADAVKEMIGDAIRNAAMRFGVAIDLWSKEDLNAKAPEPVAPADVIAQLVKRVGALPLESQRACKAEFRSKFGPSAELRASQVAAAADLVASYEVDATGFEPVAVEVSEGAGTEQIASPAGEPVSAPKASGEGRAPRSAPPSPAQPMTSQQRSMLFSLVGQAFPPPPSVSSDSKERAEFLKTMLLDGLCPALGYPDLTSRNEIDKAMAVKVIDALKSIIDDGVELVEVDGVMRLVDADGTVES